MVTENQTLSVSAASVKTGKTTPPKHFTEDTLLAAMENAGKEDNYDLGNCLALDDGEPCVCVQGISYSLLCNWFRNAVLPADHELLADVMRERPGKCCAVCGKPVYSSSNRAKYCPACAKQERRKQDAKRKREQYWNLRR